MVNWYFVYSILFFGIFFAPSGAYLLWQHTGWETMFFYRRNDLHGLLPTLFAATNVLLGVFGFLLTALLISCDYRKVASMLPIYSYGIMFSILGFGYKRFLFSGNENDWLHYLEKNETHFVIADFFLSEVFITLLVMGIFILPPIYYAIIYWPVISTKEKLQNILSMIWEIFKIIFIGSLVYAIFILYVATPNQLALLSSLKDFDFLLDRFEIQNISTFSHWSPLIGFVCAEIAFFSLVILPHIFTTTVNKPAKPQVPIRLVKSQLPAKNKKK